MIDDKSNQSNDNTSNGLNITPSSNALGIEQQNATKRAEADKSDDAHELNEHESRTELQVEQQVVEAYSGILPHPSIFNQYSDREKDALLRYANALIIDESKRQDRLTDAEISNSRTSMWLTWILFVIFFLGAIGAFVYTRDAHALWALTPAVITALLGFSQPIASQSSRDKTQSNK